MSALQPTERLQQTERVIAFIRLGVVAFNIATYLAFAEGGHRGSLALSIIAIATVFSIVALFWSPSRFIDLGTWQVIDAVADNLLIVLWLYATGGPSSPYFPLFYAEAAASVGRFGFRYGTMSAFGSALLYVGVVVADGGGPVFDVTVRTGYIFVIASFVGYVVEVARSSESQAAVALAETEALREVARLKSTFVSNVSHELRTPLTTIRGAALTLLKDKGTFDDEQRRSLLEMLEHQSSQLARLIQDILDLSFTERGELRLAVDHVAIDVVVSDEIQHTKTRMQRDIRLALPNGSILITCDGPKIARAFRNVLENAVKFSSDETTVLVELVRRADHVEITVEDQGIGIAEGEQDKIFDRFYQVDSSLTRTVEGAGIGLTVARDLMALHGGSVKVTSTLGSGTRVTLVLPMAPEVSPLTDSPSV
jgi:two-component system, OmpR family, sensor histidine kinase SenX3